MKLPACIASGLALMFCGALAAGELRLDDKQTRLDNAGELARRMPLRLAERVQALKQKKITAPDALRAFKRDHGLLLARSAAPETLIVRVNAVVSDKLLAQIKATGAVVKSSAPQWNTVVVQATLEQIAALSEIGGVTLRQEYAPRRRTQGVCDNHADIDMKADQVRTNLAVDGTGFKIGVVSDSINDTVAVGGTITAGVLAGSNPQVSGDLPAAVQVVDAGPGGGSDEGAGMLELIHDVAPGAPLAFASCGNSQTEFAQNILRLRTEGNCRITVDDIAFLDEPFFQDGPVSQAVTTNFQNGIPHFTAAGNDADNGIAADWTDINPGSSNPNNGDEFHDWGGGNGAFLPISVDPGDDFIAIFQWNQRYASFGLGTGARSDLDIYVFDTPSPTGTILAGSADGQGTPSLPAGDPVEIFQYTNSTAATQTVYLAVNLFHGVRNNFMRIVFLGNCTFPNGGAGAMTIFGHAADADGVSVGAIFYDDIAQGGTLGPDNMNINAEPFTSKGGRGANGVPYYFDTTGQLIAGGPLRRDKPDIAAPDGTNTTFFGSPDYSDDPDAFPNFFGTSAAAPNAAAAAALVWQQSPSLTAAELIARLKNTATDIVATNPVSGAGPDDFTGFGLIDTLAAVTPAALNDFLIDQPADGAIGNQTAGTPFPIRITARDASKTTVNTFNSPVTLTSTLTLASGGGATTAFTNGRLASHMVSSNIAGACVLTATAGVASPSNSFTIGPAALDNFLIERGGGGAIGDQFAGVPFAIRIVARDQFSNMATQFTGNVALTSAGTLGIGSGATPNFSAGTLEDHSVAFSNTGTFTLLASTGMINSPSGAINVLAPALQITSGPAFNPNPAVAGAPVQLSIAANLTNVSFSWNFGDGSPVAAGPAVTHTYAAPGTFTVSVTATDALFGQTTVVQANLTVLPAPGADGDTDDDGFSDEIENDSGSDPNIAASTPLGLSPPTAVRELTVTKLSVKLKPTKQSSNSIQLSGKLPVAANAALTGKIVLISAGGVTAPFTLDKRGSAKGGANKFKLAVKGKAGKTAAQDAAFSLKLGGGDYFIEPLDATGEMRKLTVQIYFGGERFDAALTRRYKSTPTMVSSVK